MLWHYDAWQIKISPILHQKTIFEIVDSYCHVGCIHPNRGAPLFWYPTLVEISQNVTSPFMTTCDLQLFATRFGNIATTWPNFNYFGHSRNYDATIRNFILLVELILHLFSSINTLIYPISRNSHQISYIVKVLYNDIRVYFNVCTKIIYNMHTYVYYLYNEFQN